MKPEISQEKGEQAINKLEKAINALSEVNQSNVINLDFASQVSMMDAEKKRIKERMSESTPFFKEAAERALQEYSDRSGGPGEGLTLEEGARKATKDMSEIVDLYKIYVDRSKKDKLPNDKKIKEQINNFLKENYL